MISGLINITTVLSLLLFVATMVMWVRSYHRYDAGPFPEDGSMLQVDSLNGEFAVTWHTRSDRGNSSGRYIRVIGATTEFTQIRHYRQHLWFDLEEWWENQGSPTWLHISIDDPPPALHYFRHLGHLNSFDLDKRGVHGIGGIGFEQTDFIFLPSVGHTYFRTVVMPYWLVAFLAGVLPFRSTNAWVKRRRLLNGVSPSIRATVAFGVGIVAALFAVVGGLVGFTTTIWLVLHGGPADILLSSLLCLLLGTPVAFMAFRYRRTMRRIGSGNCPICGYDLRASKDRCPECGTAMSQKTKATA